MKVIFSPLAIKKLKKIGPAEKIKALKKIEQLKTLPITGKQLQGEFSGIKSLRAWPLRILYTFDPQNQTIKIITIDYRGSVYN